MNTQYEIQVYITSRDTCPVFDWLTDLNDRVIVSRIWQRLAQFEDGNFGDAKPVGDGVYEARYHMGAGYRLY